MHVNLTVNRCLWITMPLRPVSELASPALIRAPAIGSPFVENPSVARTADLPEKKPFQTFLTVGDEAGIRTVITTLQARVVDSQSVSQKDVTGGRL